MPPFPPFGRLYRAYPHVTGDGQDARLNTGGIVRAAYPLGLDVDNDASAWMAASAAILVLAEILRFVGLCAYWVGIARNEASVPASHVPRRKGCLRMLCP